MTRAHEIDCPTCKEHAGAFCVFKAGRKHKSHAARIKAAEKLAKEKAMTEQAKEPTLEEMKAAVRLVYPHAFHDWIESACLIYAHPEDSLDGYIGRASTAFTAWKNAYSKLTPRGDAPVQNTAETEHVPQIGSTVNHKSGDTRQEDRQAIMKAQQEATDLVDSLAYKRGWDAHAASVAPPAGDFDAWWESPEVNDALMQLDGQDDALECAKCMAKLTWDALASRKASAPQDELEAKVKLLSGAIAAQDERERLAGEQCGVLWEESGCDWPWAVAEEVAVLRGRIAELKDQASAHQAGEWIPVEHVPVDPSNCWILGYNYDDPNKGWWLLPELAQYANGKFHALSDAGLDESVWLVPRLYIPVPPPPTAQKEKV